jgi:hypothetical protein
MSKMKKRLTKKEKLARFKERHKLTKGYQKKQAIKEFNYNLKIWKLSIISRDKGICQKCNRDLSIPRENGKLPLKHPHHIISFNSVKKYLPQLVFDTKNGILLCARCHKDSPNSAHQSPLEFTLWLMKNKPEQYNYLVGFLK